MADSLEFILVLRIGLDAQASRQDELTDGGAEAGEEGIEWLLEARELVSFAWFLFFPLPILLAECSC